MMKYLLDTSWKEWIQQNISQGSDKDEIVSILLQNNFHPQTIINEMQYTPVSPALLDIMKYKMNGQRLDTAAFGSLGIQNIQKAPKPREKSKLHTVELDDVHLTFSKKLQDDKVHLYTIDNFLTYDECDALISRIKKQCRPSTITNPNESDEDFRTSQTCDLSHNLDSFIEDLDRRIADYLGYEVQRSEGIQGQYYQVGNQFKAHTDYFEPNSQEYVDFASEMGQRTWTFMIYLNDVPKGGETEFGKLGQTFTPQKGQAVVWNSMYSDGRMNPDTLHWAKPILKGEKYIITKWFRTHGTLKNEFTPFLHNAIPAFTKNGFEKKELPKKLYKKLYDFYRSHRKNSVQESTSAVGTFIHTKEKSVPTKMIELSDTLREDIFQIMQPQLEEWSGKKLKHTAIYGIREYQHGASLDMHVDRYETHVISMIINVDQEVNEDWVLYIYDHLYHLHKVVLKPGEVVFYESAKLAHGRPKSLNGNYYANIFAHTMPTDWEEKATSLSKKLSLGSVQQKCKFDALQRVNE